MRHCLHAQGKGGELASGSRSRRLLCTTKQKPCRSQLLDVDGVQVLPDSSEVRELP